MAYYDYDRHSHHRPRYDSYYRTSRDIDAFSRHAAPPPAPADGRSAMRNSSASYYSYEPRYAAPTPPKRSSAHPYRPDGPRKRWPPAPSVEDEAASLAKEFPSTAGSDDGEGPKSRGSVDQYPIIEEIEQPRPVRHNDERRFVLVSDPSAADGPRDTARDRRRKSFAERGNLPHLKTDIDDPPIFTTERTPTPYAFTKPQKESLAPSGNEYFLSPQPITPSSSSAPRSVPSRDPWDARDQNSKPTKSIPIHTRYDSTQAQPPRTSNNDVFDDSDADSDTSYLKTERKPARYSFVKSELQKEDLRTNLLDNQAKSERRKWEKGPSSAASFDPYSSGTSSSGSSKHPTPPSQSPRSSTSSLNGDNRKSRPAPVETSHSKPSRYPDSRGSTRPASPLHREVPSTHHREIPSSTYRDIPSPPRSPRLPPRRPASPTTSRPSSKNGTRPPSPLSFSQTVPQNSARVPVTEADWHATYPPPTDRSRPTSRHSRYDTMPVPMPRIDVQSPSPARPPKPEHPLPYPVDDRPADAFMPPEEQYQYDHSYDPITSSPRQPFPESPVLSSPRERQTGFRPPTMSRHNSNADEHPRSPRGRSNSVRSQSSYDGRRERKTTLSLLDKPLPNCPRSEATSRYNDWYTLENCPNFDICPTCYDGAFAGTPFAVYFSQTRRHERGVERFCDFSSPWMRLAWMLTIKQRRQSPDLLYQLATLAETERRCPGDRELSTEVVPWYGIPDQRDGVHVANFAVCPLDFKMMEVLFPSIRGYFTRLPASSGYGMPNAHMCSLRVSSRRFPKYLDLLVELDAEASSLGQRPNLTRFVHMARENAFKSECTQDKALFHKPWHFIPQLPEFTVCQECFEELVWPAITSTSERAPSTLPKMFNRTIQPVPGEDPEFGSSCCLYSPRMRKVWERSVKEEDFGYLKRKALERKRAENRLSRDRKDILAWMADLERGTGQWERAKADLKENEKQWNLWE